MAGIIKSGQPVVRGDVSHTAFNFEDITGKAQQYLTEVKAKASQLIADAQKQADAIRKQAATDGQRQASQQAEQQIDARVKQQLQSPMQALQQAANELSAAREALLATWETQVVELAVAIASRVTRHTITQHPEITIGLIRESLKLAADESQIMLQLNPEDVAALGKEINICLQSLGKLGTVEICPVEGITRGGCRVVTSAGEIDQQLETQLQRIESELTT